MIKVNFLDSRGTTTKEIHVENKMTKVDAYMIRRVPWTRNISLCLSQLSTSGSEKTQQ